ncbi:MAG: ATP-dependent helicase HrpB [Marinobacter sp.]|uniref:ATP-dependent helicase HrpB n=1 Tax=Marinobacter sp. TaxID=50741 RepID=UPI00349FDC64
MLPIDAMLPQLLEVLATRNTVLLQAPPGAGKTTRVPPALLGADWVQGKAILMLEPRRLAARSAARFMAAQLREQPGQRIGYRTRLDSKISPQTRIEVVTEGILTRLIQDDPALERYAAILFDEFHERSLQADLGLALVRESQQALRDDLRVVVMSATLDTAPLARLLNDAPVLSSEGRAFPVAVHYAPVMGRTTLQDQVEAVILHALSTEPGSLLVFLPGAGEIRRTEQALQGKLPAGTHIAPLYGNLTSAQQDMAIAPASRGERKIVLATAIAETSLTIEGIRVVIDSGQQRGAVFDANSGMTRLITRRVSRAAAEQRKGRAGRIEAGACYRLWSETEQFGLREFTPPAIQQADLTPMVLELAQWGARSPEVLAWIDPPPSAHWQQALDLLKWLDLLDDDGAITDLGKAARNLGCHPRLAHMMLRGRALGWPVLSAQLTALLEERDLLGQRAGADVHERIRVLRGEERIQGLDAGRLAAVRKAAQRWLKPGDIDCFATPSAETVGRLLALAYPDRIARQRPGHSGRYLLSNGRGATLRAEDPLVRYQWLACADLDGQAREAHIYLAAPLEPSWLEEDFSQRMETLDEVSWDERRGTVVARRQQYLGKLVLAEQALPRPAPALIQRALLDAVRTRGLDSLPWSVKARQWCARVLLLRKQFGDSWPDVGEAQLLATLADWLGPFMPGLVRWSDLQQLDLSPALSNLLSYDQQQLLNQLAPEALVIPAGQSVSLDYTAENGPVLAAKLQALFGWQDTPRIGGGRVPVVIHLLSPARRSLAITSDLRSFWQNTYPEVRKDMRGRYPKHPWPENPLDAEARSGTKKQGF